MEILPNYGIKAHMNGYPYPDKETATKDLMGIVPMKEAVLWADWLWDMVEIGEFQKAKALIFDVVSKFISICKGPAVENSVFLTKNMSGNAKDHSKKYLEFLKPVPGSKNTLTSYNEKAIFACALEASKTDQKGELIPPWEVEKTAHLFLKDYCQMDNNHDEWAGAGTIIESWVPKAEIEMMALDGILKTFNPFSWFVGFEPSEFERTQIENGDRDGLSIGGEWPKIIFSNPGVKSMDDAEKKFFTDLQTSGQKATVDLLTKQAEENVKTISAIGTSIADGLKPLADVKTLLEQKAPAPAVKDDVPPAQTPAPGVPPVATPSVAPDAASPAAPAPSAAPPAAPPAGTPPPAAVPVVPDPSATGTQNPPAQAGAVVAPAAAGSDTETPDQKVVRMKAELVTAEADAKLHFKAQSSEGSPTGDTKTAPVILDIGAAFAVDCKKGTKAMVKRE